MTYSLDTILQLENSTEFNCLHQFNPLKVLRVDQYEIRHSNVLAWLFDPNENHRLGSFFLRKVQTSQTVRSSRDRSIALNVYRFWKSSMRRISRCESQGSKNRTIPRIHIGTTDVMCRPICTPAKHSVKTI